MARARNQLHATGRAAGLRRAEGLKRCCDRPRNRRKPRPKRSWLPAINWRALGTSLAAVAGVLAAVAIVLWALDQPIETVSVTGRFQRVSPADVERVVKNELHGAGPPVGEPRAACAARFTRYRGWMR